METLDSARLNGEFALGAVRQCVQEQLRARIRKSLGLRGKPVEICHDARFAYLPVDGAAREIHGDLSSMMVGGIASLLLQILHPQVMAGVAQHSSFREDPLGRLSRTARFVATTTYGSSFDAIPSIERVRAIHSTVRGHDDQGVSYRADDPHLLAWVHITEVAMFLSAVKTFGPRDVSAELANRYVNEMATVASDLGIISPPRSMSELTFMLDEFRPELRLSSDGSEAKDFVLRGVAKYPQERIIYSTLAAGAISILPPWAREKLEIRSLPLVDGLLSRPATALVCLAMRLLVTSASPRLRRDAESTVDCDDLASEIRRASH